MSETTSTTITLCKESLLIAPRISTSGTARIALTYPTIPERTSSRNFALKLGLIVQVFTNAEDVFAKFALLPKEIQMMIWEFATEQAIGPQHKDSAFGTDLWYTETSLFDRTGNSIFPNYMDYHTGGVIGPLSNQGIGSKTVFRNITHTCRLSRQVAFEYWKKSIKSCLAGAVNFNTRRTINGRPLNSWDMQALNRRNLVLEVLEGLLKQMHGELPPLTRKQDKKYEDERYLRSKTTVFS